MLNLSAVDENKDIATKEYVDNKAFKQTYTGSTNEQYESAEGYVRSLTVEGKSEKWNQMVPDANTHLEVEGTYSWNYTIVTALSVTNTHKYYLGAIGTYPSAARLRLRDSTVGIVGASIPFSGGIDTVSVSSNGTSYIQLFNDAGGQINAYIMCIDLTAIFGAGNEPTTVDAFKATDIYKAKLAAGELYDYDAGSLVSIEGVSVGDGTITTPLRSAGSAHDELVADADSWTVERKIGVVDLGTLTWNYYSSGNNSFMYTATTAVPDIKPNTYAMLCSAYRANGSVGDKRIVSTNTTSIRVFDSSYTDPTAFKNAMSGVYLFYELATPTVDPETSMDTIEIGSAFTVATDLDSTFELTTIASHTHSTSDITSGVLAEARGGTGASSFMTALNTNLVSAADDYGAMWLDNDEIVIGGSLPTDYGGVPDGGSAGQVLTKTSSGYAWQTPSSGTGRQSTYYTTCSTAQATAAKVLTISGYTPSAGDVLTVYFSTANTANAPTINLNSTGAKAIYVGSAAASSTNQLLWNAGDTLMFVFSGSYWYFVSRAKGDTFTTLYNNTTGTNGTVTLSSSAANFDHMRIYFKKSSGQNGCGSVDVYSPNGKYVNLTIFEPDSSSAYLWFASRTVYINGTSVSTYGSAVGGAIGASTSCGSNTELNIIRIEAWK